MLIYVPVLLCLPSFFKSSARFAYGKLYSFVLCLTGPILIDIPNRK